jgi:hypothetical protein
MAKTAKTTKSTKTPKARKPRTTRPQVVSFRITSTQAKTLSEIFNRDAASGVNSPNQLARKVVCDYLAGRLDYRDPADKLQDLDVVGA